METKVKEEAAKKVGTEILFGNKWLYIIGGVLVVILLLVVARR